jgi:hypothetical protein
MGHLIEAVLTGLLPIAKFRRAFSGDVAEDTAECTEAVPSRLKCDLYDRKVRIPQQRFRALDSAS